jgi:serine/threonine protein phosphatase PrpC
MSVQGHSLDYYSLCDGSHAPLSATSGALRNKDLCMFQDRNEASAQRCAEALVKLALEKGTSDNVTALVVLIDWAK